MYIVILAANRPWTEEGEGPLAAKSSAALDWIKYIKQNYTVSIFIYLTNVYFLNQRDNTTVWYVLKVLKVWHFLIPRFL